jgi:hypothetical protein
VDEEVAVIAQHPFALLVAFDARWKFAPPFQLLADFVGNGLILARVRPGADDKIVGETGYAGEVQNPDVGGLFLLGGPNRNAPPGFGLLWCTSTL